MKGHIREYDGKRGKTWRIVVSLGRDPETHRKRQHWETVRTNKRDAQIRLRELLTSLDNQSFVRPTKLTVAQWLERWLQDYAEARCCAKTVDSYRGIVRVHLNPGIGSIPLKELQPHHLSSFYKSLKGKMSVRTVRYCHTLMCQSLDYAVSRDVLNKNVARKAEPPAREKKPLNIVQPQEIDRLFDGAPEPYHTMFETLLFTGLRRGELLALRWRDLDLAQGAVHVNQTLYKLKGEVIIKAPKTKASRRIAYLPAFLVVSLSDYRAKAITHRDDDLVFSDPDGKPLDPSTVSHAFKHLIEKAGLKDIRLHDLRHSYASLLLKSGKHPMIVSAQLGHASIRTTLDTYSHLLPGMQADAVKSLEAFKPRRLESD